MNPSRYRCSESTSDELFECFPLPCQAYRMASMQMAAQSLLSLCLLVQASPPSSVVTCEYGLFSPEEKSSRLSIYSKGVKPLSSTVGPQQASFSSEFFSNILWIILERRAGFRSSLDFEKGSVSGVLYTGGAFEKN